MHTHLNNKIALKSLRSILRKEMTPQERILWSKLRDKQLGVKFRRQHSIGNYILDFYSTTEKLAIELDGSQHADAEENDKGRTLYLESLGIRVLRFWNNEVNSNLDGVLQTIYDAVHGTPPQPSPSQGRET